jgi:hypothetical protein
MESFTQAPVMQGSLSRVFLADFMSIVAPIPRFIRLEFYGRKDHVGSIWTHAGDVVDAEMGDQIGREAFMAIFLDRRTIIGDFRTYYLPDPVPDVKIGRLNHFLLDAVHMEDQMGAGSGGLAFFVGPATAPTDTADAKNLEDPEEQTASGLSDGFPERWKKAITAYLFGQEEWYRTILAECQAIRPHDARVIKAISRLNGAIQ